LACLRVRKPGQMHRGITPSAVYFSQRALVRESCRMAPPASDFTTKPDGLMAITERFLSRVVETKRDVPRIRRIATPSGLALSVRGLACGWTCPEFLNMQINGQLDVDTAPLLLSCHIARVNVAAKTKNVRSIVTSSSFVRPSPKLSGDRTGVSTQGVMFRKSINAPPAVLSPA